MKPHNSVTSFTIHINTNISSKITIISYPLNKYLMNTVFGAGVTKLSIWNLLVVYSIVLKIDINQILPLMSLQTINWNKVLQKKVMSFYEST